MAKQDQNSIQEPTDEELVIYKQLIQDIPDVQMDDLSNDYFTEVAEMGIKISFARYLINRFIRPIKEGDTIQVQQEDGKIVNLFCLIRKNVEGKDYLLFAQAASTDVVDEGQLDTEFTYLFYVDGRDAVGTEIIDIMAAGEETERILDIMEGEVDAKVGREEVVGENQPGQG